MMSVGNGTLETNGENRIQIPPSLLTPTKDTLINFTYENFNENTDNVDYLQERAILCGTNHSVNLWNDLMLNRLTTESRYYLSADSLVVDEANPSFNSNLYPPEFLHSLECNGVPPHNLRLNVGAPVLLIRNLDTSRGLCNGTRLMILSLQNNLVEAQVITGTNRGDRVTRQFIKHHRSLFLGSTLYPKTKNCLFNSEGASFHSGSVML